MTPGQRRKTWRRGQWSRRYARPLRADAWRKDEVESELIKQVGQSLDCERVNWRLYADVMASYLYSPGDVDAGSR